MDILTNKAVPLKEFIALMILDSASFKIIKSPLCSIGTVSLNILKKWVWNQQRFVDEVSSRRFDDVGQTLS